MSIDTRSAVTLGADVGGSDAHAATHNHVLALRKLLQLECQGTYSDTINEFALVLRIDGSVQSWGRSGVENVILQRKKGYATADIFVPMEVWSRENSSSFRDFLAAGVRNAVVKIAEAAQRQKVTLSIDKLSHDIDSALDKFLDSGLRA